MTWEIRVGDVLDHLRAMPDESVHCVVTSPPYWGLRDYGEDGQLGLEPTPGEYVAKMVEVFRDVRRVLRNDGTLWLNLGDCYNGVGRGAKANGMQIAARSTQQRTVTELKSKDLVGIPWRVAFALQADGWWLRSDIIWHKPNPMPESVRDRPTKAHEYVFLLSKSERYFYDADAVAEESITGDARRRYGPGQVDGRGDGHARGGGKVRPSVKRGGFNGKTEEMADTGQNAFRAVTDTRNRRSVWTITTKPYREAHFATFPPELPEVCVKAGCPEGGTVLDPFSGAGTTGMVALRLGRSYIGIELNPGYAEMSRRRIDADCPLFNRGAEDVV